MCMQAYSFYSLCFIKFLHAFNIVRCYYPIIVFIKKGFFTLSFSCSSFFRSHLLRLAKAVFYFSSFIKIFLLNSNKNEVRNYDMTLKFLNLSKLNGEISKSNFFSVAISASIFPIALENLKPWPEQGLAIITFLFDG